MAGSHCEAGAVIRLLDSLARTIAVGTWCMTALFAWLVSVPFANQNFIRPRLLPDFIAFAERHAIIIALTWPAAWWALRAALATPRSRRLAQALLAGWVLAAVALPLLPSLVHIPTDARAMVFCVAALIIPAGFALIDLRQAPPLKEPFTIDRTGIDAIAVLLAAGFVFAVYSAQALAQGQRSATGLGASALTHLLTAAALLLVLTAARAWGALRERPVYAEFWLGTLGLICALNAMMTGLLLPALSVSGTARWLGGVAMTTTLGVILAARGRVVGGGQRDGVLTALSALVPRHLASGRAVWPFWLAAIAAIAWGSTAASRVIDWNFLVLRISVVIVWVLSLASALTLVRGAAVREGRVWLPSRGVLATTAAVLGAYLTLVPAPTSAGPPTPVDAWMVSDPSFRTLRDWLRPPAPADEGFYVFLAKHTNLGPDIPVRAFDIRHAPLQGQPSAYRPHIFLITIDSLRRDYLLPYNEAATFTPAIGRFAAENLVYERPFTRYGATGLSVPSMWVGGLVPHQQYPKPYAPFNALNSLLLHEGYDTWLSWDNIVEAVVPREGSGAPLSANRAVKDFRFCEMIGDVRARLDTVTSGGRPVFTWGLAQDIHVSAITREGGGAIDNDAYPGFNPPHASRIKRVDACFGAFIDDLKARRLYDDSIVILTSDHGDSLGEEGRWGHAYTLFPEILQVPLIVHVPARLRAQFDTDLSAPVFTADLTPTLYRLLGHETTSPGPMFGQPILWPIGTAPPRSASEGALVASSYGSVYGWVSREGRELYVSDGVSLRDYRYHLDGSPTGRALAVDDSDRRVGQTAIEEALTALARFYKLDLDP